MGLRWFEATVQGLGLRVLGEGLGITNVWGVKRGSGCRDAFMLTPQTQAAGSCRVLGSGLRGQNGKAVGIQGLGFTGLGRVEDCTGI